ncbi:MAG: hypothetical protein Q4G33_12465 [bacterium]|nr:hypothetical protein [bacterium]
MLAGNVRTVLVFPELSFMERVKLYGELCEMMDGDAVILRY